MGKKTGSASNSRGRGSSKQGRGGRGRGRGRGAAAYPHIIADDRRPDSAVDVEGSNDEDSDQETEGKLDAGWDTNLLTCF